MKEIIWLILNMSLIIQIYAQAHVHSRKPSSASNNPKQFNVLFIVVDDLRPELGCYGAKYIHSPNIDRLAANGITFTRAYCQQAICSPSRTSVLTGLRPDATGVYDLVTHFRKTIPGVITLPEYFKQNKYYTVGLGKVYHLDDDQSWNESALTLQTARVPKYLTEVNKQHASVGAIKNGPAFEKADVADTAYIDGKLALRSIEYLRKLKDQPFFLAVGFHRPHLPFNAPQKYWNLYDPEKINVPDTVPPKNAPSYATTNWEELRNYQDIPSKGNLTAELSRQLIHGYYASVSYVDAQVGVVLNELKRLKLDKNTIVVLWGDHGWKLGEYGDWTKHTNFELDTRTPLIISVPGMKNKIKTTKSLVEFVDIYPTLCELTGLPMPSNLQGNSVVPLLHHPEQEFKSAAFSQYPRGKNIIGYTMRTDRYRFTQWVNKTSNTIAATELYDHKNDSKELVNVAHEPDQANIVKELSLILAKGWQNARPKHP